MEEDACRDGVGEALQRQRHAEFVRLMLPHHQGAIDMARTQLLYGRSPEMPRLAQEIIADQQSEIELMRLWLKKQGGGKCGPSPDPTAGKDIDLKGLRSLLLLCFPSVLSAQQVPWGGPNVPVTNRDRVYAAEQFSNYGRRSSTPPPTGSWAKSGSATRSRRICRRLYRGQLIVHGLGFARSPHASPVVSIGSNSVTLHRHRDQCA